MLEDGYEYYGSLFDELDKKVPKNVVAEAHEQPKEDDLPTIKHGHWEYRYLEDEPIFFQKRWYCSVCGRWTTYGAPDYCMHCGAKMDEVEE